MNHWLWIKNSRNGYGIETEASIVAMTRSLSEMLHMEEKWRSKGMMQLSSIDQLDDSTEKFRDHRSNMVLALLRHHHSKTRGRFCPTEAVWNQSSQGLLWLYIIIPYFYSDLLFTLCTKSCSCHRISNFGLPHFTFMALFFIYWAVFYVLYCRNCKQLSIQ